MSAKKREVGKRWMKDGIRIRQGKHGRTFQIKVASYKGTVYGIHKSMGEALEARDRARIAVHDDKVVLNNKVTVREYLDSWLRHLQTKKSTKTRYTSHTEHIKNALGDKRLQDLTPHDVRDFVSARAELSPGRGVRSHHPEIVGQVMFSSGSNIDYDQRFV